MAHIKYFSDDPDTVELASLDTLDNQAFRQRFPGVRGIRSDGFAMLVGRAASDSELRPVTRKIEYKAQPSRHVCNAKCRHGSARGICECSCGGKNHGRG